MKINKVGTINAGQDGTVFLDLLFRFDHTGICYVYDLKSANGEEMKPLSVFSLDKSDIIAPHSNSVFFGSEYYTEDDEFPLLYSNIYNNYARCEDKLTGVCCVYRLQRLKNEFKTTLVQLIEIGFVNNRELWCSEGENDIRPYGNFAIDCENNHLVAFTMRDKTNTTRYFTLPFPKLSDGELDSRYGVNRVTLKADSIIDYFDCEYHRFIQGAATYGGRVYSLEGFTADNVNIPALRIVSLEKRCQEQYIPFGDYGLSVEPELIAFSGGICYYCDHSGNLYTIDF